MVLYYHENGIIRYLRDWSWIIMELKYELLANSINTIVRSKIEKAFDDVKTETEAIAYVMLFEIKQIVSCKEISDSDKLK